MYSGIAGVNGVMDEESYDGIAHSMDGWVMYPDTKGGGKAGWAIPQIAIHEESRDSRLARAVRNATDVSSI